MLKKTAVCTIISVWSAAAIAQSPLDTATTTRGYLEEVTVTAPDTKRDVQILPEVVGTAIYAGKKNSLIVLDNVQGNIATNTMRQVLAKVPGIQVWESDASGIQIGVAARGLSPNRSWEFNVRQNGYDISSDPFGYPEAYYNPQLQAVQRIQVVRGAGALQYGPQFGGMINYLLRNGSDIAKPFQFETQQTIGSFGLFNTFNAVGGSTKKLHYYAFFDHRNGDGWRENSRYKTNTGFATVNYKLTDRFSLGAEVMVYDMLSQQAGGLTDSQFAMDAQQSYRARNWFSTPWKTAALNAAWDINANSKLNVKLSGMWGDRNSVGYLGNIATADTINATTLQYNNRDVQFDQYRNYSLETRYLTSYSLGRMRNTFSTGVRAYHGNTARLQRGKGTTGSDYDMSILNAPYPNSLIFGTDNAAVFAENIFRLTDKLLFIPGARYEYIQVTAAGRMGFNADGTEKNISGERRTRSIFLAGAGAEFHTSKSTELYGNFTQAYRPMLFSDLSALPTTDVIDPDLKDAKGYNADLGYRGTVASWLLFDVSVFYLQYNNRIGLITQQRPDGSFYNFRTNVGNSTSKGAEALIEVSPLKALTRASKYGDVSLFVSYGYTDARYGDFKVVAKTGNSLTESNLKDKKVENAPEHILRSGLTYSIKGLSLTYQLSYASRAFSNANNTETPSADGTTGAIPAYTLSDLTLSYQFARRYNIKAGVNNLGDARYFTRRGGGFPGPGLLPADGRTVFLSVGARL